MSTDAPGIDMVGRTVPTPEGGAGSGWYRRVASTPLWLHCLALTIGLLLLLPVGRTDASFSSDEGAAIVQAKRLAAGSGWLTPNGFRDVDPEGQAFFYTLSEGGPDDFAVYAKHPVYVLALAALDRVGGVAAMEMLSVAGAVLAALAAALIARRLDRRLAIVTFWTVGIASPMIFYSQTVLAHSVGAALTGFALLGMVRLIDRWSLRSLVAVALLLFAATMLRSEVQLLALAMAVGFVALSRWRGDRRHLLAAVAVVAASGAATMLDRVWVSRITTHGVAVPSTTGTDFLNSRASAAVNLLVLPGATWPALTYFGLIVMLLAVIGASLLVRRSPFPATGFAVVCAVAVVAALTAFMATPDTVPSLLITCPVITAGAVLLTRRTMRDLGQRTLVVVSAVFLGLVLALQYAQGGGAEWGSRFLVIAFPAMLPAAIVSIVRAGSPLPRPSRRVAVVALVLVSLIMSVVSVASLRYYRGLTVRWVELTDQALSAADPGPDLGDGDRRPIVITSWAGLGRMLWAADHAPRGLSPEAKDIRSYLQRLHDRGTRQLVLVSFDRDADLKAIEGLYRVRTAFGPTSGREPVYLLDAI